MESKDEMITQDDPSEQPETGEPEAADNAENGAHAAGASEPEAEGAPGGKTFTYGLADVRVKDKERDTEGLLGELAAVAVKATAVALSFIVLLTCLLAVALPLSTMRIMNKLGMSARSVDFGEIYIEKMLKEYDAGKCDSYGNYIKLNQTEKLNNADFVDALYVCINLSYDLMEESYASGNAKLGRYYAERVEKYTRMYSSLSGVSALNAKKDETNIANVPSVLLRPVVYSYRHSIYNMNFRARSYLGKTDKMLFSRLLGGQVVTDTFAQSTSFAGYDIEEMSRDSLIQTLDDFVDYVDALGEYLDVQFILAGVENDLSKKHKNASIVSETAVQELYYNVLSGKEFGLLFSDVNETDFSGIYTRLKQIKVPNDPDEISVFTAYAQAAVNFSPGNLDEQLHRLYWIRVLSDTARRLWYTSMLLNYNRDKFGQRYSAIQAEYSSGTCESYNFVEYGGGQRSLSDIYRDALSAYLQNYRT